MPPLPTHLSTHPLALTVIDTAPVPKYMKQVSPAVQRTAEPSTENISGVPASVMPELASIPRLIGITAARTRFDPPFRPGMVIATDRSIPLSLRRLGCPWRWRMTERSVGSARRTHRFLRLPRVVGTSRRRLRSRRGQP